MCTGLEIASIIGLGGGALSSLTGAGKGKKTEYAAMAPEYQQQFSEDFMKFLQGQIGQGATPYGGQIAASAMNPFTQSALGLWGMSPYGGMGQGMPPGGGQMPQQGFLGGQPPRGTSQPPQRPMPQRPMPQGPPQGGMGGQRRGVPFQR